MRAPSLLHDYRVMENAIGDKLPRAGRPAGLWAYRFALDRGHLDALLNEYVARPFVALFRLFDRLEGKWAGWLNGTAGDTVPPSEGGGLAGRPTASPSSLPHPAPADLTETRP